MLTNKLLKNAKVASTCKVKGCHQQPPTNKKGYCIQHYTQLRRYGHITNVLPIHANTINVLDTYAEIVLCNRYNVVVGKTKISLEDVARVEKYRWRLVHKYVTATNVGRLHRLIKYASSDVDHINGDTLDNRRDNLRLCTVQQNAWNTKAQCNNKSGFKGVHKVKHGWKARMQIKGKSKCLGTYKCRIAAAWAYHIAAIDIQGPFAKANMMDDAYMKGEC